MTPSEAALGALPLADFPGERFNQARTDIADLFKRAFEAGLKVGGQGRSSATGQDEEKMALARRVLGLHKLVEEVKKLLDSHCVYPEALQAALEEAQLEDQTHGGGKT